MSDENLCRRSGGPFSDQGNESGHEPAADGARRGAAGSKARRYGGYFPGRESIGDAGELDKSEGIDPDE